jgi:acyl transferase domain-containing protein
MPVVMAIVGVGCQFGPFRTAAEFERALYEGNAVRDERFPDADACTEALRDAGVGEHVTIEVQGDLAEALHQARLALATTRAVLLRARDESGEVAVVLADAAHNRGYAVIDEAAAAEHVQTWQDTGPRAALTAVVKAALHLHHRYLHDETGRSHLWFRATGTPRRALVGEIGMSEDRARGEVVRTDWARATDLRLLPVSGGNVDELVRAIGEVRDAVRDGADLGDLARGGAPGPLRAVFCVRPETVLRELDLALTSLPGALNGGKDWVSPAGSHCAVRPVGPDGAVALVFPGMFSPYPWSARELYRAFPGAFTDPYPFVETAARSPLVGTMLRMMGGPRDACDLEQADLSSLTTVAAVSGRLHTRLLRELLGPHRFGALGYSIGEFSMLVATGRWDLALDDIEELASHQALQEAVTGVDRVVRAHWNSPEWGSRVIFAPAEEVRAVLHRFDRVFLTHVNTPAEVVIAGDPARCQALAEALGRPSMASARGHLMHTPLLDASRLPTILRRSGPQTDVRMFTANGCRPLASSSRGIAEDLTAMLRHGVDFPRLLRGAYLSGYRYFIEVGTGGVCTRWVRESLAGRPHVAETVERRGVDSPVSLLRLLATLSSNGLEFDPTPFLPTARFVPAC